MLACSMITLYICSIKTRQQSHKNKSKMKKTTLLKRLEKRYTGSKNAKAYQIVKDLASGENNTGLIYGKIIRPAYTLGRKRYISLHDYTRDVAKLLDLCNVRYIIGNDAPKGGKTGNYIKILTPLK